MTAMIDVRGVRKSFGPVPVLRGVDLTVAEGSVTCVIGQAVGRGAGTAATTSASTSGMVAEAAR